MAKKTKTIINTILFLTLIIITFLIIFKDYDFKLTINLILKAKAIYLVLAFTMMGLYFLFQSVNIKKILSSLGKEVSLKRSIKYSFIGFFFSAITPGGSGGQPMQIYYMRKEGVPVSSSTIALILHLCIYHIVTIIFGIVGLIMNYQLITKQFLWIFIVGLILKFGVLFLTLVCLFSKKITKFLVKILIKVLTFIKYARTDEIKSRIDESLDKYHKGAIFIKHNRMLILRSAFYVALQVLSIYTITFFVHRALGLHAVSILKIISIQALLLVSTSSIPIPGAVGISESAYLSINQKIFGKKYLASALVLNRGINFYFFVFISFLIVMRQTIKLKKLENIKE